MEIEAYENFKRAGLVSIGELLFRDEEVINSRS